MTTEAVETAPVPLVQFDIKERKQVQIISKMNVILSTVKW